MIQIRHRAAIAMIELIFAIVIMGIILMSAPMLISTATKSSNVALQQEAIVALSSEIGMILTHHWDEGNTDQNLSSPILVTTNGDADLVESVDADGNPARVRAGTSPYSRRNFLTSSGDRLDASTLLNTDGGDRDDIDDFVVTDKVGLLEEEATSIAEGDYIDREGIQITTAVSYINDSPSSGSYSGASNSITLDFNTSTVAATSNIKLVDVTLSTTEAAIEKDITLKAFACNIGTYELEERTY